MAQHFCLLFPNRTKAILRPSGCKSWVTVSKHWPIPDETVLSAVAGEEASVWGLRWGQQTRFAVLDVDQGSKYHSALELRNLQTKLAAVELKAKTYRSSESGGWHVYLFWQDWTDCPELQETLKVWLYSQGYEIRNGTLEVFPSGNGLRIPLQPGFAWLDDNAEVITERKELTVEAAISRFLSDLKNNANNWENSKKLIKAQLEAVDRAAGANALAREERLDTADFEGLFNYRLIPEKYEEGRRYWKDGLTKSGQRHDAILGIEHYLWHGDEGRGGTGPARRMERRATLQGDPGVAERESQRFLQSHKPRQLAQSRGADKEGSEVAASVRSGPGTNTLPAHRKPNREAYSSVQIDRPDLERRRPEERQRRTRSASQKKNPRSDTTFDRVRPAINCQGFGAGLGLFTDHCSAPLGYVEDIAGGGVVKVYRRSEPFFIFRSLRGRGYCALWF